MNKLRLFRYFLPQKMSKELLLIAQVVLMILFAMAVMSPLDIYYRQYLSIHHTYKDNHSQMLFFNPSTEVSDSNDYMFQKFAQELSAHKNIDSITYAEQGEIYVPTGKRVTNKHTGNSENEYIGSNLLLYSEDVFQKLHNEFCSDSFPEEYTDEGTIPILISQSISNIISIGTTVEMYVSQEDAYYECMVIGILNQDAFLPTTTRFGSYPSLDCVGTSAGQNSNVGFIISKYDQQKFSHIVGDGGIIISLKESVNTEKFLNDVNSYIGTYGKFYSMSEIEKLAFTDIIRNNRMYIFEFILLTFISVFGYGGYLFLSIRNEERTFSIFHILGMTRKRLIAYQCIKGLVNLIISLSTAIVISPWFQNNILGENYRGLGVVSILYCIILLALILLTSLWAAFRLTKNATAISVYRGGD